jgi:heterodisulfide reductase subunit A-like polyferredoxin
MSARENRGPRILYCHCAYAKVIPEETKAEVLRALSDSGRAFDAVADLCEMSAQKDPALNRIAASQPVKIAACFPRAVQWLFHAAKAPLPEKGVEILNMRETAAAEVVERLLAEESAAAEASP